MFGSGLVFTGCAGGTETGGGGTADASTTEHYVPPEPVPTTDPIPAPDDTWEIWEWSLGRDAWNDPDLAPMSSELGLPSDTTVNDYANGYQLALDESGTVVAVVLYNDEVELGWPESETTFMDYPGSLPLDLTWYDTVDTVEEQLGVGTMAGGWGTEITYSYETTDGYVVEVSFAATHESDLLGAWLHTITVR